MMQIDLPLDIFNYPDIALPEVWTIEQLFDTPALQEAEIVTLVTQSVDKLLQGRPDLKSGSRIAVGTGSRGLDNLVLVIKTVVTTLKQRGFQPFLVPAMGSHGGATAEGQKSLVEDYGLTRAVVGAEIFATMDVVELGGLPENLGGPYAGQPVYYDRNASEADAVILVNRIKPHTDFTGEIESGIGKMAAIGLGKRRGAESIHQYGAQGLRELMPRVARFLATNTNILGGVALIENQLGKTAEVHAVPSKQMANEGEKALLRRAREISPRIPFDKIDVLVVDLMGKNISGAGMDTHVIGRGFMPSIPEHTWGGPDARLVVIMDLTPESHGNATALGLADITTAGLIEKVDFRAMLINMRTSGEGGVMRARLPLVAPTRIDAVKTAFGTCGRARPSDVRFARIRSTADTRYIEISGALLDEAKSNATLRIASKAHPLDLDVSPHA